MEKNKKSILKDTIHPANEGDVIGGESLLEAQEKTVAQKVQAKINIEATALKDILDKTEVDTKNDGRRLFKEFFARRASIDFAVVTRRIQANSASKNTS